MTRSLQVLLLALVLACQQSKTSAPVAVTKSGDARVADSRIADAGAVVVTSHIDLAVHAAIAPCPIDAPGPIDHELFPGCPAAPYTTSFSVCPHGECPKPCRVELEARKCCPVEPYFETQAITYDAHGRFLAATHTKGTESGNLLDVSCTYAGDHAAKCQNTLDGRPTVVSVAKRDDKGLLTGVADGESDASYSYSGADVIAMDAGRDSVKYTYNTKHQLVRVDDQYKRDHTTIAYTYNAAGDVIDARTGDQITTYSYDAKRRPVTVTTKPTGRVIKLEWDDEDRLIKETADDNGEETSMFIYKYTYDCSKT